MYRCVVTELLAEFKNLNKFKGHMCSLQNSYKHAAPDLENLTQVVISYEVYDMSLGRFRKFLMK